MSQLRERIVVGAVLLGGPVLFYLLLGRGQVARIERLRQERLAVEAELAGPMPFDPLSREERKALADPAAPWRGRIPVVQGDQGRIAHYHWVVSEFQRASREAGAAVDGLRSSWDPIRASFSLPERLPGAPSTVGIGVDQPERRLQGWVLEARYRGATDQAFRGLQASGRILPLLEPVGFRWEAASGGSISHLALRNLVLEP